jgi:hypothetical protein
MHHLEKLPDLIRLRFTPAWLQAKGARDLRVCVDMVTPTDPAQCEAECLDKPAEFRETDVSQVARYEAIPKFLSA